MVYGYGRVVIFHMSVEGASQNPSQWIVHEVSELVTNTVDPWGLLYATQ